MSTEMHRGYVRTDDGTYLIQIPDADSRWGFYLCDDDQSWPGGFGVAEWEPVKADDVPADVRDRMDWILDQ